MPDEYEKAADLRQIANLRKRAQRARQAASQVTDKGAANGLMRDAEEFEVRAYALEAKYTLPAAATVPSGEPSIAQAGAALKPETSPEPKISDDEVSSK